MDESLPAIVRRVSDAGYDGIEFAKRIRTEPPEPVATALADGGIKPVSIHADLAVIEAAVAGDNDLLDRCHTIGCDRLIIPHLSAEHFRTRQNVRALSTRLIDLADALDGHGIDLGMHTLRGHLLPMVPDAVGTLTEQTPIPYRVGEYAAKVRKRASTRDPTSIPADCGLRYLIDLTDPADLFFEVEVAEIRAAGVDPAAIFPAFAGRDLFVHLRDVAPTGPNGAYEDVRHGSGVVDIERIASAARVVGAEWLIYENELDEPPESIIRDGSALLDRLLGESDGSGRQSPVST